MVMTSGETSSEDLLFEQDLLKSLWGCVVEVTEVAV